MTSKTKIQILNDCFNELRINGSTVQADSDDIKLALYRLEDYIAQLQFDVGYNFETVPNPNSVSGIPPFANLAIALGMALNLCPPYGKVREAILPQATGALSILQGRLARPKRVTYPSRQPLGMGNRFQFSNMYQFMPETISAPTSPQTEQMNIGDIKKFSIDFSAEMPSAASISSYTTTVSSGLTLTSVSLSGMKISFTVQATVDGYQQILFSVIANNGEKSNRVLDFNINDTTSLRANP
jgi:hypothetical protein